MNTAPAGRCVVITRPEGESQRLAALIRDAGGEPLLFPVIAIQDAADPAPLDETIARLDDFDLAIFISPSAAGKAMTRITTRRAMPAALRCAAIGPGGARALARFGIRDVIVPEPTQQHPANDSESLLATAHLQNVHGKRIVIFRGDGGRELLERHMVLAQPLHDPAAVAVNPPAAAGPSGSVQLGTDGSMAAFLPARRAATCAWPMCRSSFASRRVKGFMEPRLGGAPEIGRAHV